MIYQRNSCEIASGNQNTDIRNKKMSRRDFLLYLGVGTSVVIAGYFLQESAASIRSETIEGEFVEAQQPQLKDDVVFGNSGEMKTISRISGGHKTLCAVNRTGRNIIELLNGRRSIEEISQAVAIREQIDRIESMDASIACFVAEVGMLGFLMTPFYAQIIERRTP